MTVSCKDIPERELIEAVIKTWEIQHHASMGTFIYPYNILNQYPEKVVLAKMGKLVDSGALNYGVSLRTAWVEQEYLAKHYPDLVERNRNARNIS